MASWFPDSSTAIAYSRHIVHPPAGGYGTTEADMDDQGRNRLLDAGREAMRAFLAKQSVLDGSAPGCVAGGSERALANQAPAKIVEQAGGGD